MLNRRKEITDQSVAPFETYLLVSVDYGCVLDAYEIADDTPLDIDAMLTELYDIDISTERALAGPNNATIITDNRPPDSVVVWESLDFYFD
jgi:hypothetical protein